MSKDLEKKDPRTALMEAVKTDLENITVYLETLLPFKGAVERFKRMTITAIMRDPKLLEANRTSFLLALIWCAVKDLEPGVDDGVWLIPFNVKNVLKVVPIVAYKGLIKKAVETESVTDVQAYGIYEKDDFDFTLGLDPVLNHKPPKLGLARGKLIGAYVVITKPDGTKRFEVIDRETAEKIRNAGAAWKNKPGEGPWADWEEQMFLKTVIKRGLKLIPVKPAFRDLLTDENRLEGGASVAALLQEVRDDLPAGLVEPEEAVKPKEPDTAAFDKLVEAQNPPPERLSHLQESLASWAAIKKMTVPQAKEFLAPYFHAVDGDAAKGYWPVFLAWEAKKYSADKAQTEQAAPEPSPPPDVPPPGKTPESEWPDADADTDLDVTPSFEECRDHLWKRATYAGLTMTDWATVGVQKRLDIIESNFDAAKDLVDNYKSPAKGSRGKK